MARVEADLEKTFRRYLASGVTSVVDVGGGYWNFEVREMANQQLYAPRTAVAGPLVSTVSRPQMDIGDPPIIEVDSPEMARELVRKQLEYEPDLIKIWFIVPRDGNFTPNLPIVEATIDEAHAAGVRVAVHATQLEAARASVKAGADILVHSVDDEPVDDEFIALGRLRFTATSSAPAAVTKRRSWPWTLTIIVQAPQTSSICERDPVSPGHHQDPGGGRQRADI